MQRGLNSKVNGIPKLLVTTSMNANLTLMTVTKMQRNCSWNLSVKDWKNSVPELLKCTNKLGYYTCKCDNSTLGNGKICKPKCGSLYKNYIDYRNQENSGWFWNLVIWLAKDYHLTGNYGWLVWKLCKCQLEHFRSKKWWNSQHRKTWKRTKYIWTIGDQTKRIQIGQNQWISSKLNQNVDWKHFLTKILKNQWGHGEVVTIWKVFIRSGSQYSNLICICNV